MKKRHVYTLYRLARRLAQFAAFAVFCCLPWLTAKGLGISGNLFALDLWGLPFADPAGALQAIVCGGGPKLNALLVGALSALLLALVLGRVFCSWICPFGLLSELVHSLARLIGRGRGEQRASNRVADRAFWGKTALLVCCVLVMALWGVPLLGLISLPGELSLLPLPVWLGVGAGLVLGAAALPLFALSAEVLTGRRLWCRFVCPQSVMLGAAAAALPPLARRSPKPLPGLRIVWRAKSCSCKKESPCAAACPLGLTPRHVKGPPRRDCTLCGDCLKACAGHGGALGLRFMPLSSADATGKDDR